MKSDIKTYTFFLLVTFGIAVAIYTLMKQSFGPAGPIFLLTAAGQVHFIMAYIWSLPAYRRWPASIVVENIFLFGVIGALIFFAFYQIPLLDKNQVWLIVILLAVLHFARDYRYFLNQISSNFYNRERPLAWTLLLASLFFAAFFGLLLKFPLQETFLFYPEYPVPTLWHQIIFFSSIGAVVVAFFYLRASWGRWRKILAPENFLSFGAFALPVGVLPLVQSVTLMDMILFVAFWHLVQWDGFTILKISGRGKLSSLKPASHTTLGIVDTLQKLWGRSVPHYIGITALYDAILLGPFFFMISWGVWPNFTTAVNQSFFWGLPGYALFSSLHFVFTALLAYHAQKATYLRS